LRSLIESGTHDMSESEIHFYEIRKTMQLYADASKRQLQQSDATGRDSNCVWPSHVQIYANLCYDNHSLALARFNTPNALMTCWRRSEDRGNFTPILEAPFANGPILNKIENDQSNATRSARFLIEIWIVCRSHVVIYAPW